MLSSRPSSTEGKTSEAESSAACHARESAPRRAAASPGVPWPCLVGGAAVRRDETARPAAVARITAPISRHSAASRPSSPHVIAALSRPADCDAVRKATTTSSGTPLATSPAATGSMPHEQSGVARPASAPVNGPALRSRAPSPSSGSCATSSATVTARPRTTHGAALRTSFSKASRKPGGLYLGFEMRRARQVKAGLALSLGCHSPSSSSSHSGGRLSAGSGMSRGWPSCWSGATSSGSGMNVRCLVQQEAWALVLASCERSRSSRWHRGIAASRPSPGTHLLRVGGLLATLRVYPAYASFGFLPGFGHVLPYLLTYSRSLTLFSSGAARRSRPPTTWCHARAPRARVRAAAAMHNQHPNLDEVRLRVPAPVLVHVARLPHLYRSAVVGTPMVSPAPGLPQDSAVLSI